MKTKKMNLIGKTIKTDALLNNLIKSEKINVIKTPSIQRNKNYSKIFKNNFCLNCLNNELNLGICKFTLLEDKFIPLLKTNKSQILKENKLNKIKNHKYFKLKNTGNFNYKKNDFYQKENGENFDILKILEKKRKILLSTQINNKKILKYNKKENLNSFKNEEKDDNIIYNKKIRTRNILDINSYKNRKFFQELSHFPETSKIYIHSTNKIKDMNQFIENTYKKL